MTILDDSPETPGNPGSNDDNDLETPPTRRTWLWVTLALLIVGGAAVGVFYYPTCCAPAHEVARREPPAAAPAPAPPPTPPAAPVEAPAPAPARPARRPKVEPAPEAPPPSAPAEPDATKGTLRIDSDVPGASVFIDRVFVGTTPAVAKDVAPGAHQLNASVAGYDGVVQSLDVAAGAADVMVRFKEVKLSETIEVVHKHGMGSCEGHLVASVEGLRYDTPNKSDAFSVAFKDLEAFDVDYLKKNLRVKQRNGKTFNFTDKHDNADNLFVFHRNVEQARAKLAAVAKQ